ncbi:co-chaperone DjlA [Mangrovimicrobium sediminis]|uniref:Co-chaperone DjlA n=1 Tax=Mangrovimicrobium sediminis TaxID=2562682 RepID=A0A4Z0M097_9GAMM|nr:co-chaperone DjlA [Haliea sp. SAOS-164]TGD72844.1 co-chaperone DjlA [Haliea sp. SAOS-164]
MFYGKLIGGVLGLLTLGPIGLVAGIIVGHFFDRGLGGAFRFASPENIARVQRSFFETTFLLSGYLAKADGHISQQEIDHTETVIANLGLNSDERREAIELFRRGAAAEFQPQATVSAFLETCSGQRQLQHTLLMFLVSLTLADHQVEPAEREALLEIGRLFGVAPAQLEQLLRMAQAQGHFHGGGQSAAPSRDTLADAYAALGVSADIDDKALKHAYRKLMSENHPDKLIARGVPEHMVKLATEKSQEIQSAYETIRKSRGLGK